MKDRPLTACCSVSAYADPVYVVGGKPCKIRIGEAARCPCGKLKSDFRADRNVSPEVLALQNKLTGVSWSMAIDNQIKKPGSPLHFEVGPTGILQPEFYKGEVRAQAELEEPPF